MVAIKEVDSLPLTLIQGGSISNSSNTCVFIGVLRRGWRDTSYLNTKNGTQATEYRRKYLRYVPDTWISCWFGGYVFDELIDIF